MRPATEAAGARLAPELRGGMVITVAGELGAGKTTLVRGCLRALGWEGPVKSPTYTLVEYYPFSSLYFYHFDFYRFADPSEWETAGLADCFRNDAACVVEWPERVGSLLPLPDLALTLAHPAGREGRRAPLALEAHTEAGERCLTRDDRNIRRPAAHSLDLAFAPPRVAAGFCSPPRNSPSRRHGRSPRGSHRRGCGRRRNTRASFSKVPRRFRTS